MADKYTLRALVVATNSMRYNPEIDPDVATTYERILIDLRDELGKNLEVFSMDELIKSVSTLVNEEYRRATAAHGGAASSPHEGYALAREEADDARDQMSCVDALMDSLWLSVKADDIHSQPKILRRIKNEAIKGACEFIQVAAMADKAIAGIERDAGGGVM